MKKQLGIMASLLFLCTTALIWAGCANNRCCDAATVCEQPASFREQRPVYQSEEPIYHPQELGYHTQDPVYQPQEQVFQSQGSVYQPQETAYQPMGSDRYAEIDSNMSGQPDSYAQLLASAGDQGACPTCPTACPTCPTCPTACPQPLCPTCPAKATCPPRPVCPPKPTCPSQACPPPCPPCPCPQQPPCEPDCKMLVGCKHPSSSELCCKDGLIVSARNPRMCMLGDQYPLEFDVKACDDLCEAMVSATLPEGVSYVRSQPEARVEGRKVSWNFGPLSKGECRPARVWLKCDCEGELCVCFCASAVPVRFCALLCAKPVLTCKKCGPEQVCPGDPVEYTITVTNRGSCAAEDVVVTDTLPDGVEHASGLKTLVYKLGCLEPCACKTVNICTTAVKRGKYCNTAVVTACNADSVSCESCVCICCCQMECSKVGPKEQQIGKNADYQITVMNTGDLPLTDIVVYDRAPTSTSIVAANGATISGNTATWRLKEMKPGEKVNFNITLTTCVPGCFTNKVDVTNCQNCNGHCEAMTHWKGRPALNICVAQTENPICIGDSTGYMITIVNQGSEADNNVRVVATFPGEVQPTAASGDSQGQISGNVVRFEPVRNVAARQTLRYRIDGKAMKSGDARINFEVSSDAIKTPISQQESTIVN